MSAARRRPEVLSGAGSGNEDRVFGTAGSPIQRYPLTYAPRSSTAINWERLPPEDALRGMELAFREEPEARAELARKAYASLLSLSLFALVVFGVVGILRPALERPGGLAVASFLGVVLAAWLVFRQRFTPQTLLAALLAPLAFVFSLYLVGDLQSRLWSSLLLAAVTFALFALKGGEPLSFFAEWLYTAPHLRPETRRRRRPELSVDLPLLGGILGAGAIVSSFSPALGLVSVASLAAWPLLSDGRPWIRFLSEVVPLYFGYGEKSSRAAGVWIPPGTAASRRTNAAILSSALFVSLGISLYLFFPWDMLTPAIRSHYAGHAHEQVFSQLQGIPWAWMLFVIDKLTSAEFAYGLAFPVAFLLAVVIPAMVAEAIYRKPLRELERLGEELDSLDREERPEWEWYVERLRKSEHETKDPLGNVVREREHLFLGVEPYLRFPILLDEKILREHCYIVGESGAGKTSMGIMPLLIQLLRGPESSPPPAVLILDLKGDLSLFHTARLETEARRWTEEGRERHQDFLYFTTVRGSASHRFNPFSSFDPEKRSPIQVCQLVLDALDLNHGPGYGRSYYTGQSRHALALVLEHIEQSEDSEPVTFRRLKEVLSNKRIVPVREKRDAFQLIATIEALSQYEQLVTTKAIEEAERSSIIHMPRLLEERQVAYFSLSAIQESITVREIGQLALFALMSSAIDRKNAGLPPREVYLVIDEFQRIASRAFEVILEQARQFGVSVILANQTQGALETADIDLRPAVRTNTRTKMFFAVSDPREIRDLMEASGEELAAMHSWSTSVKQSSSRRKGGTVTSEESTWTETIKPRLSRNDIAAVGDHPLDFIAQVSRGSGYTQFSGLPFLVRTTWPVSEETYRERDRTPWPPALPEQVVSPAPETIDRAARTEAERLAREDESQQDALSELAKEIAAKVRDGAGAPGKEKPEGKKTSNRARQPGKA